MITKDREAFDRLWASRRLMMGQGPWLTAYNRALIQFNAERIREGAAAGGRAAAESLSPEGRRQRARTAAKASHSPTAHARAIARVWGDLDPAERAAVRAALGEVATDLEQTAVGLALHAAWEASRAA